MDVGTVAPQRVWHQGARASALSQLYGLHGEAYARRAVRLTERWPNGRDSHHPPLKHSPHTGRPWSLGLCSPSPWEGYSVKPKQQRHQIEDGREIADERRNIRQELRH